MVRKKTLGPLQHYRCKYLVKILYLLCFLICQTSMGQIFEMDTVQWTGDVDQRINIVFFGDGYLENQLDQYRLDVDEVVNHFFSQVPFREYRSYFNIVAFRVPSNESGASLDPKDPLDTYFGSSFNSSGIERLLVATRTDRAQAILFEQFPLYDQAVLIVNDTKYGGSGGWLATTSTNKAAPEIALHEIGHSFAGLSDEYWAGAQFARESPNMTQEKEPSKVKWKNWLEFEQVGVFQHSGDPNWYKPHTNCKMQILNPAFCPVCKEAIAKKIQSLVDPTLSFLPEQEDVVLEDDTIHFDLTLLEPEPNSFQYQWFLDGDPVTKQTSAVDLLGDDVMDGLHLFEVIYVDTTVFIRDSVHRDRNTYTISWNINRSSPTPVTEFEKSLVRVFPNPALNEIGVYDLQLPHSRDYEVRDQLGRLYLQGVLKSFDLIDIGALPSGLYHLILSHGDRQDHIPFVKQ